METINKSGFIQNQQFTNENVAFSNQNLETYLNLVREMGKAGTVGYNKENF